MKNKSVLISGILLITLSCISCGQSKAEDLSIDLNAIVSGKSISPKNKLGHSIVAITSRQEAGNALCTGSIIGKNLILTAAHCVDNHPKDIQIIFGIDIHKSNNDNTRKADKFIIQPNWQQHLRAGEADLAIIHFEGELPNGYTPVKLADENLTLDRGTKVLVAGYGVTNSESNSGAGKLRQATTEVIDQHSETEIVTDGEKSSVCFGDSGGPAFIKINKKEFVQWGVASSVANQACNQSSIHTEVMKFRHWIELSSKKLNGKNR